MHQPYHPTDPGLVCRIIPLFAFMRICAAICISHLRIRDTSRKTCSKYGRITKGQLNTHFAANMQRTTHAHCRRAQNEPPAGGAYPLVASPSLAHRIQCPRRLMWIWPKLLPAPADKYGEAQMRKPGQRIGPGSFTYQARWCIRKSHNMEV